MRLLLDANIFLWWQWRDRRLPSRARALIEERENEIFVSAATIWHMLIAQARLDHLTIATEDRQFARYDVPLLD